MTSLDIIFMLVTVQLGLPVNLLNSICYNETKYNIYAVHINDGSSDSIGICQIKYNTAKSLGFKGNSYELMYPQYNVYYAGLYLKHQLKRYNGNIKKAVIAYNYGHAKYLTYTIYQDNVYKYWRGDNRYEF